MINAALGAGIGGTPGSANVKTAANPRGVTIALPRLAPTPADIAAGPPRALTTSANPRGVSLNLAPHAPTIGDVRAELAAAERGSAKAQASGGWPLGAIRGAGPLGTPGLLQHLKGAGPGVLGTLANQIFHLPLTTLEGTIQLGKTAIPAVAMGLGDAVTGNESGAAKEGGKLLNLGKSIVTSDPIYQAISTGSTAPLEHNPLGVLLDATGLYGAAGDAAGALARTGALGDAAKSAAALGGRGARAVLPGVEGTALPRGYSTNLMTKGLQVLADRHAPAMQSALDDALTNGRLTGAAIDHNLRKQVAAMHTAEQSTRQAHEEGFLKALARVKPGRGQDEERNIAPLVALTGQNRAGIDQLYETMLREGEPADAETAASRSRLLKHIEAMQQKDDRGKFNWEATNQAAEAYAPLIARQEAEQHVLGMRDVQQMAQRVDNARALLEPNVHYLDHPITDPRYLQAAHDAAAVKRQAVSDLTAAQGPHVSDAERAAQANLDAAKQARTAYLGETTRGGARGAYRGASAALADVMRSLPVHPATDALMNKALDLRQILDGQHPELRALHDAAVSRAGADLRAAKQVSKAERAAEITARKADVTNAERALLDAGRAVKLNKLRGAVIEDDNVPAVRAGHFKGLRVRPLTAEDVAGIRAEDPARQSYVSAVNPERRGARSLRSALGTRRGDQVVPMAEHGGHYTGEALKSGDIRTGWSALPNTLLRNERWLSEERETQNFLRRFSIPADHGRPLENVADAKAQAAAYGSRHGIKVATVERNGELHNVPESAVTELNRQRSLDRPTTAARLLLTLPNRVFRETVLPYSPKLPIMHNVENLTRTALLEHGNPVQAVQDFRRGRAILSAMSDEVRGRLRSLLAPGTLSRTGAAGDAEDLGRFVNDPAERTALGNAAHAPVAAVKATVRGMDQLSRGIIHVQRYFEKNAQTIALGNHGRQLLQEFGHSYLDASASVDKYAEKLAEHLATPADAERAADALHTAYGKYNAFTANTRVGLRLMPFGSWYMNAARLVFQTLPRDHPLFDALLQDTQHANAASWNAQHAGLPPDMQASLPVGPHAYLDIGKLLPLPPAENPAATAAKLTLPIYSAPALALGAAEDPFGRALVGPNTPYGKTASNSIFSGKPFGQGLASALEQVAEGMGGPLNDIARGLYGHGGIFYNTSTPALHLLSLGKFGSVAIKPGSTSDQRGWLGLPPALDKVLDPSHPTTYGAGGNTGANQALGGAEGTLGGSGGTLGGAEGHL